MESDFMRVLRRIKNSLVTRVMVIGFLILILLIPFSMIRRLVDERKSRRDAVTEEISSKWALQQTVRGPFLDIPYKRTTNGTAYYAHFLPEKLHISSKVVPEVRKRGIYESVVYTTELVLSGEYLAPDFSKLDNGIDEILWEKAALNIGVTDLRGISRPVEVEWLGNKSVAEPGLTNGDVLQSGVNAPVSLNSGGAERMSFSVKLTLKGSERIYFLPLGRETKVEMSSSWPSPKFVGGRFIPVRHTISEEGFKAEWEIFDYNREFPQQWMSSNFSVQSLDRSRFGVELFREADEYQVTTRSVKYAVLFIFLTFLTCFLVIEVINKKRIHPVQYLLVGFALTMFYLLLISISEHIDFRVAYLIAAAGTIGLITLYVNSIAAKKAITFLMLGFLSMLYGFLFVIIQLEEYSLIMGSAGLFVILAAVMFFTRKLDWYNLKLEDRKE